MSRRQPKRVIKPPQRYRDGVETDKAAEGESSGEERSACDEEQPSSSGRQRGRGRMLSSSDASGSGDFVRDRSRSPHEPRWRTETDADEGVPQLLRFIPKRAPGVQPPLNMGNPPPEEIFSYFFDAEILKLLSQNTNRNAAAKLGKGMKFVWTNTRPEDIKTFIGMLVYMSIIQLPKMSDFWHRGTAFHVPFPATIMPRDRFMAILSNIHMSDPEEDKLNEAKKGTEDYDRNPQWCLRI